TDYYTMWWPTTLLYARGYFPFEIFAKSKSKSYFSKIKELVAIEDADKFKQSMHELEKSDRLPRWEFDRISPVRLSNADDIATIE
ncbi:hypothetical protein GV753_24400, partial [Enterobacter cloacae]|nr:hypothetical protein [Enterobacter cloacae]